MTINMQEFIEAAESFKNKLDKAVSFDEILAIWRSNEFPYKMNSRDPFSSEYRNEVKEIYKNLSSLDYDTQNELTSSKQSFEQFEIGSPWTSKNLDVISKELAKVSQAMLAIHRLNVKYCKIIGFGSGWGNLAVPLARSGLDITIADIDQGFLDRTLRICQRENLSIAAIQGDFLEIASRSAIRYDVVLFQASFHHCFEFDNLLDLIRDNLLTDYGSILFFSEPIYKNLPFPWGLRYDGESLWAIMCNKWLELGFQEDFFAKLMILKGFFLSKIDEISGYIGEGWSAKRGIEFLNFDDWVLPSKYDETFYSAGNLGGYGRFSKDTSSLPGLKGGNLKYYEFEIQNYGSSPLKISISGDQSEISANVSPNETHIIKVRADCDEVTLRSDVYIPHMCFGNGDNRQLGLAIKRIRMFN
ncbi:class I SAM-dependent methyltransferase [Methylobacterium sp. J-088]|uniref:class I SAM-dependent methyltransferase n=1 Tax=Methylobacterium sp. J-088 TaxID=2836664 RepID=UPI001FB996A8|nr:class I SAM-dependent methyltransferase [Methylobacterium sp. J-088]MCJ2066313.1 class I SAM-dependent methyltransferase [Methylobacterium sp. J-088]